MFIINQFAGEIPVYLTVFLLATIFLVDFIPAIRSRNAKKLKLDRFLRNDDYTIFIPIFGKSQYLEGLKPLRKYGSKVLLVTTNKETDEFYKAIYDEAEKYGYQVAQVNYNNFTFPKKSSISITKFGVRFVKTKYMIRMDADSIPGDDLSILFGNIEKYGLDLVSIRVLPLPEQTGKLVYEIQRFEYENAMDVRSIYPYLTSGAAISGKTEVFQSVMPEHSCFFNGEDIEFGKIAWDKGYTLSYLPFEVFTEIPGSFKSLWKQRVDWSAGGFRHSIINIRSNSLFNIFYFSFMVYILSPFRLYTTIENFYIYPLSYSIYVFLSVLIFFRKIDWMVFVFPFYSFIQSTILPILGTVKYFERVNTFKTFGVFKTRWLLSTKNSSKRNKEIFIAN